MGKRWLLHFSMFILPCALCITVAPAHPMPNSVVLLTIHADRIDAEVQIPLSELQAAFGHAVNDSSATLVARLGPQLRDYLNHHIRPQSPDGRAWTVFVGALAVQETQNLINGTYRELKAQIRLVPSTGETVRRFVFHYDVVIHQVVTHTALVSIRQDWETGRYGDQPAEVGVIRLDVPSNTIPPLQVNQAGGGLWQGLRGMIALGMQHIAEGTDHLLFLLVLLLPAPLLVSGKRWAGFGGLRYSLYRLLRVVTAFTLGHSLTLLVGALGWVHLPSQPVEVLIAFSILISAIHAWRPLFPGREAYVAAGFGLMHGLAFADTLTNLNLDAGRMALSILGFNIGIELMQLLVIAVTVPWLILLSRTLVYSSIRVTGALLAAIAALAWVTERSVGKANPLTNLVEQAAQHAPYLLLGLALVSLISVWWERRQNRIPPLL